MTGTTVATNKKVTRGEAVKFFHALKEHFMPRLVADGKFYAHRELSHRFNELDAEYSGGFHNHMWKVEIKYDYKKQTIEGRYQIHNFPEVTETFATNELDKAIAMMELIIDK